jgi:2,4-diaminopentanoate dehydrogenase
LAEGASGIPVVAMGLGHVGQAIARAALEKAELRIVAAVDPAHAGRRLDEVLGSPAPAVIVAADAAQAFLLAQGGVVLHATGSEFEAVLPELEAAVLAGLCVVSTCEELAWPFHHEGADRLDELCEEKDVAVVGVGVNPGFSLDRLPAFLSQATGPVRHVRALRVQDAARRRPALQRKVGAGLDEAAFYAAAERGEVGHVGLSESAMLVAHGCGFELEEVEEEIEAVLAERDIEAAVPVKAGRVSGLRQVLRGFTDGAERVRLELVIASGTDDERDEVEIDARPPIRAVLRGGLPGDLATAWAVVNAAPAVTMLPGGLATVLDLPSGRL